MQQVFKQLICSPSTPPRQLVHSPPYVCRSSHPPTTMEGPVARKSSSISSNDIEKVIDHDAEVAREVAHDQAEIDDEDEKQHTIYTKLRPFILVGLALVILGWWISATILKPTRHRWYDNISHSARAPT